MRVAAFVFKGKVNMPHFAEACLRFTPQIALCEPDRLFLEIGRSHRLFTEPTFLLRAEALLRRFGLEAQVAVNASVPLALAECVYREKTVEKLPLEALKLFADPFRMLEEDSVTPMIEKLTSLGLARVGDFLKLPAKQLATRFGQSALLTRYRVVDELSCPWPQWVPEAKIIEEVTLGYEDFCGDLESLLNLLDGALERFFLRLWGRSMCAAAMKVVVDFERLSITRNPQREFIFDFMLPQKSKKAVRPMIWQRLEKEFTRRPLESAVQKVRLEVLQMSRDYSGQRNFFHNREEVEEQFNAAIAQLVEGLGKENVFRARIKESAVPEKSWERSFEEQKDLPDVAGYLPQRPTRLLRRPERVFVTENSLLIRQRAYKILAWSVVEQISTDWIATKVARSYYRVELEAKPAVWLFKDSFDDYYLHGYFE
jgi:hypothetical protein